jgi:hypothetical protein
MGDENGNLGTVGIVSCARCLSELEPGGGILLACMLLLCFMVVFVLVNLVPYHIIPNGGNILIRRKERKTPTGKKQSSMKIQ